MVMVKIITIIVYLSLGVIFNSYAHDSDRVDQLEKELHDTKERLSKIESMLVNTSEDQVIVNSSDGWKSVRNWRKLTTGMSYDEVRKILGEPHRIDGGMVAEWRYKNGGRAGFFNDSLRSWDEPFL